MTKLSKPIHRLTNTELSGCYVPDRGRKIVVTLVPSPHEGVPDQLVLRPAGTRRGEVLNVDDCYAYALKCRSNRLWAQKMAGRKAKKAIRLAAQRQMRAEKRLFGEYPTTSE